MKTLLKIIPILLIAALLSLGFTKADTKDVKCLIQLSNYDGEGAYVVISLLNPAGEYEETLYVQGKDDEWFNEIDEWWKFYGKHRPNIDAISGATVGNGERTVSILHIPADKIDKGYQLRFETAVEDKGYYENDIRFPLTSANLKGKKEGTGFIRYVRMLPQ